MKNNKICFYSKQNIKNMFSKGLLAFITLLCYALALKDRKFYVIKLKMAEDPENAEDGEICNNKNCNSKCSHINAIQLLISPKPLYDIVADIDDTQKCLDNNGEPSNICICICETNNAKCKDNRNIDTSIPTMNITQFLTFVVNE